MSYTYLLDAGVESSAESFSDIPASVLSKLNLTAAKSCCNASETESCHGSQSGMMSERSTVNHGGGLSMSCVEGSRAQTSVLQVTELELPGPRVVFGVNSAESFAKLDLDLLSWKTRQPFLFEDLETSLEIWPAAGMMQNGECWLLDPWEPSTNVKGFGFSLPTPNSSEYKDRGNAVKLAALNRGRGNRLTRTICDKFWHNPQPIWVALNPSWSEMMMGWPIGWTALKPLGMDKFQQWLSSHGKL